MECSKDRNCKKLSAFGKILSFLYILRVGFKRFLKLCAFYSPLGKSSPKAQENEEKGKKEEADEENKLEEEEEEEEEEVEFSEIETNIRDNIMENEPLTNTTLESMIPAWWNEEPFR